ncbi:MAG: hypothetical protein IPG89_16955 [Bacteroidetes bacterium]|nr:hypothetical protein [Bacteroidota bacterium]
MEELSQLGSCVNATGANGIETLNLSGLTIGNTYFIEVHDNAAGGGDFTICVTNPTPPPANDDCSGAISLTSNYACTTTAGNSAGATLSGVAGCSTGNPDDDMWYSFVAVSTTHTVTVNGAANYDAVLGAYVACGGAQPTGGTCVNATGADGIETLTLTGLTIGNTYFLEVHDNAAGGGDFTICVTHPGDNCSFPISLTTSTSCVTIAVNSGLQQLARQVATQLEMKMMICV